MKRMKYFFECYFHQAEGLDDLDRVIDEFKEEKESVQLEFIKELHAIIDTKNYVLASKLIKKYSTRDLSAETTEKFIKFLYDRIVGISTNVKPMDFAKKSKIVLCPVCSPRIEIGRVFSLIYKGIIINNHQIVYICKPCKLVWLTEEVKTTEPQSYKKFMKKLRLNGTWKELKDVDYL